MYPNYRLYVSTSLFEGNPKSKGNQTKLKQLKKAITNRSLESLKEVWLVSFNDLIHSNTDNFVRLNLGK